jgi:hypothetical protein
MSEFIGAAKRGYKTSSEYGTGLLGGQYHSADQDFGTAEPRGDITSARVVYRFVKNTGSTAITPGYAVTFDNASANIYDVKAVAAGDARTCGIADPNLATTVAQGERFFIITKGPVDVVCGAAVSAHAALTVDSVGRAVTNDLSTVAKYAAAFGRLLVAAGAADVSRRAIVDFRTI